MQPRRYHWQTEVAWTSEHKGTLEAQEKPTIDIACPPEFGGHPGAWTPEDLLTSAVESCLMMSFLHMVKRHKLGLVSYRSSCQSTMTHTSFGFAFATFEIRPHIVVESKDEIERCRDLLLRSEKMCPVSMSLRSEIIIEPTVEAQEKSA